MSIAQKTANTIVTQLGQYRLLATTSVEARQIGTTAAERSRFNRKVCKLVDQEIGWRKIKTLTLANIDDETVSVSCVTEPRT